MTCEHRRSPTDNDRKIDHLAGLILEDTDLVCGLRTEREKAQALYLCLSRNGKEDCPWITQKTPETIIFQGKEYKLKSTQEAPSSPVESHLPSLTR